LVPGPVITPGFGAVSRRTLCNKATGASVCQSTGGGMGPSVEFRIWEGLTMHDILQANRVKLQARWVLNGF
jgi:DMSO/TMAO reductase YedYZ molybdopterin-dependent catalytic subunit